MTVLVIAANSLRRLVRIRENLFFVFALPLLLIVVLGLTVGSATPRIGVHVEADRTPAVDRLIEGLEAIDGASTTVFDDLAEATGQLEREDITALVVVPAGYEEALQTGANVELRYVTIPTSGGFEIQGLVRAVLAEQNAAIRATRLVVDRAGVDEQEAAAVVAATDRTLPDVQVTTVDPTGRRFVDADAVGFVAAQELILFVFLISMVAATALIQVRRLGVTRRMVATPASVVEIVAGEALGRYGIAVVQSAFIIGSTALLFGLDWGSWSATLLIVAAFSLVATAAALFIGALVSNENQATAVGISLGMALAALGGCMVPLEIFPDGLRAVAHVTPHAWAVDAFTETVQRGGGVDQIGTELAVLSGYGLVLLAAGAVALRRTVVA